MGPSGSTMLEPVDRQRLLEAARESLARGYGRSRPEPLPAGPWSEALCMVRATFTTLTLGAELRGCRGMIEPRRPLVEDVWDNAWASAYDDPRFPPVSADEIPRLAISISVLSPLEPIPVDSEAELVRALEPDVDGLVLSHGAVRATFLPAVWRQLPDPSDFVAQLKHKAGWHASFWPRDVRAYRYRTETFPAH
jgi:AmmeMemoRadiSam system protein A